jgi:hypothetical protein
MESFEFGRVRIICHSFRTNYTLTKIGRTDKKHKKWKTTTGHVGEERHRKDNHKGGDATNDEDVYRGK